MKKRMLFGIIPLLLILTLMVPMQVQAKCETPVKVTHFTAQAQVAIIDQGTLGAPVQRGQFIYQHQDDEIVAGQIGPNCPNWEAIENAYIIITHSADSIINLRAGTLLATAKGTIELDLADGTVLTGTYQAIINGKLSVSSTGDITYTRVNDIAQWKLNGPSGTVIANGNAFATLYPYGPTLAGTMIMSGTHN